MDRPTDLYTKLYKFYSKAHSSKSKQLIQKEVNEKWHNLKSDKKNFPKNLEEILTQYHAKSLNATGTLIHMFAKQTAKSTESKTSESSLINSAQSNSDQLALQDAFSHEVICHEVEPESAPEPVPSTSTVGSESGISTHQQKKYETRAQDALKVQIGLINSDLVALY
jgi:hypothetical protein